MAIDLEKYRKEPTATGGATPPVDINKYRKTPVQTGSTFNVPQDPAKASQQRLQVAQNDQVALDKEANKGFFSRFGKALGKNIAPSQVGLGKTLAGLLYQGSKTDTGLQESIAQGEQGKIDLLKVIRENEAKGVDTTRLKQAYNEQEKTLAGTTKTARDLVQLPTTAQAVGQIVGTGLDLLTAGTYGKAKTGVMSTGRLFTQTPAIKAAAVAVGAPEISNLATQQARGLFSRQGASNIVKGTIPGYASDVALGLQGERGEDREGANAFIPGLGTALGFGIPALSETTQTVRNIADPTSGIVEKRMSGLKDLETKNGKIARVFESADRKGVDVRKTLAETNLLNGAIDADGRISSDKALNNFNEFIQPYEGRVKEALNTEGRSIQLNQLADEASDFIDNSKLSDRQKVELQKEIADNLDAFKQFRGNTVPVTSVHDTKVSLASSNNYLNPSKNIVDKEAARFFKEVVEKNTSSIDVAKYNKELSKYYTVREALEAMDRAVVSGGRMGKYFSSLIGSGVGGLAGGPVGAIVGAEVGARARGGMMSRAFGGDIKKGLEATDELADALKPVATGKKAIPDVILGTRKPSIPDINLSTPKKSLMGASTGSIPVKNVTKTREAILAEAKASNDAKIKEIFGDISPVKNSSIPASIIGKPRKVSQLSDELEMERVALNIKEEALKADPARELMKYISKRGDSKGTLAEVTGKQASKTGIGIDIRATDLGFKDSESARDAVNAYKIKAEALAQEKQDFSAKVRKYKKSEVNSLEEAAFQAKNAVNEGEMFAGAAMGFEKDEDGNINFDVEKAAMGMVGLGVASSASRSTRAQAVSKKISVATKDELARFITVVKGKAVTTDKSGLKFKAIDGMTEKEAQQAFEDGLRFLEFDTKNMDNLASATPSKIASFYEEILSVPESKGLGKLTPKSKTPPTTLLEEAKKYKSAEEFVRAQPTYYRGEGGADVAQGKALLAEGKHFAMDSEYPKRFGTVSEYVAKPDAKVFDASGLDFKEIRAKLGLEKSNFLSKTEYTKALKENGYDILKYDGTYQSTGKPFVHTVEITPNSLIPKSQLTDIWKKANS